MPPAELSENHRRSISIRSQLIDEALCDWDRWIDGKLKRGVIYREVDTLSENQKRELRKKIEETRQLIIRLRDDLHLQSKMVPTARSIIAHASLLWEMSTELNSRGLTAYGMVPEGLTHYLDPIGEKLAKQMNAITALLSEPKSRVTRS